jgi:kynurenine formamidase
MMIVLLAILVVMSAASTPASAQSWQVPTDAQRCPSKWGAADQRGAGNHMKPETVLRAARLIRTGEVFELGRVLKGDMPFSPGRRFEMELKRTNMNAGRNRRGSNEEIVFTEIGQVGTQFDGLTHQTIGDALYNCVKYEDISTRSGFTKLGVENVGALMTRGVLIDVAGFKGVSRLKAGEVITPRDLEAACQKQGVEVREGDVVLLRTGHGQLWMKNNELFGKGEPGIGMAAAKWLSGRKIVLVGSDTWATEVVPHEDTDRPFEVHQWLLVRQGIYNLENLDLEELARDRVYEFAFVFAPLRLKGATGSPGNPIAVR